VNNNCVLWTGAIGTHGYGVRRLGGKTVTVHRLACIETNGPPPSPKHDAAHRCGVRACYNGEHLYWATRKQNMDDARRVGRLGKPRLSVEEVYEIKRMAGENLRQKEIASQFGISRAYVSQLVGGQRRA